MQDDVQQAAAWPAMSIGEACTRLTGAGSRFEIGEETIRGVPTRVWTRVPPTLRAIFDNSAHYGQREFLIHEEDRVTYDAFRRAAIAFAQELIAQGVRKGDRVAIIMRNLPEWAVVFYGAVLAGAIVTPLNGWWTGQELHYGLADSGTVVAIVDEERLARIAPHLDDCPDLRRLYLARPATVPTDARIVPLESVLGTVADWPSLPQRAAPDVVIEPEDDATILYTSGTTGRPKGALATHRNLVSSVAASALPGLVAMLRSGQLLPPPVADPAMLPQRVNLLAVPLFHGTGLTGQMVNAIHAGTKIVLMRRWDVEQAIDLIEREGVTATGGVPTIAWQLVERKERGDCDLSTLTALTFGGAPASPELVRRIAINFPRAMSGSGWGMTETSAAFTMAVGEDYAGRPDSAGFVSPVGDLEIRDAEDGRTVLPLGDVGELWVRGPQVVKEYWNRPDANRETFVDGWLRTGDLGRVDAEGYVYIVDRAKDMLIRGGENIYCLEVENALYEHPDVMDAAVVGVPHRILGEEPAAVVHLRPGGEASEADLRALVAERLAAFKVPVKILFWPDMLPRNANGKVMKPDLRAAFVADSEKA